MLPGREGGHSWLTPVLKMLSADFLTAALIGSLSSVAVLVALCFYLNAFCRREPFVIWGLAWLCYGGWLMLRLASPNEPLSGWSLALGQCCIGTSAVFLFWGGLRFLGVPTPQRALVLFLAFTYSWACASSGIVPQSVWRQWPVFLVAGIASLATAAAFYGLRRRVKSMGAAFLAAGFSLWGLYLASFPFAQTWDGLEKVGVFASLGLQLFIGLSIILVLLEEARASAERMSKELEEHRAERRDQQARLLAAGGTAAVPGHTAPEPLRRAPPLIVQQERLRALSHMASGVAHDINNSLTPIIGFTDCLLDNPSLEPECKKQLEYIRTSAADIAQLIEQVRQFYRGRGEDEPLRVIDLNHLATEVIAASRPCWRDLPQGKGLLVQTALDGNLPPVRENEAELRQALTHVVTNAIEAMPDGGTLTIATRPVRHLPGAAAPGEALVALEVKDTGIGMDDLTRQHCIEPFFTTKGRRGRGLGLAMVYGLMRRHRGAVEIESQLDAGTTVRLLFHAARSVPPTTRATPAADVPQPSRASLAQAAPSSVPSAVLPAAQPK